MKIYGLKTCDTCRKARKVLPDAEFVDVRTEPLAQNLLEAAQAQFGETLLNRRSTTWRGLDDAARQGDPLELIRAHPTLMKRPLIVDGAQMYLGWGPEVQKALL